MWTGHRNVEGKWVVIKVMGWATSPRASVFGSIELFWGLYHWRRWWILWILCTELYTCKQISTGACVRSSAPRVNLWYAVNRRLRAPPAIATFRGWTGRKLRRKLVNTKIGNSGKTGIILNWEFPKGESAKNHKISQRKCEMSIEFDHQRSLVTSVRQISIECCGEKEARVQGLHKTSRKWWRNWDN